MAKASHASAMQAANREDALLIAVGRNGNVWFDTEVIGVNDLSVKIRARVSQGAERKVYIRADARASYGVVLQVLDGVRAAGVKNIAFVVDEQQIRSPVRNRGHWTATTLGLTRHGTH